MNGSERADQYWKDRKKWLDSGKLAVEKLINFREDVLISQGRCVNFSEKMY